MASIPSVGSESKKPWEWCICTNMSRAEFKCPECSKSIRYSDIGVHYAGRHWHLSCLLDSLTQGVRLADNPFSPLGGAGFHP